MNIKNFAFSFPHWTWNASLTLLLCNENLWKLNIYFFFTIGSMPFIRELQCRWFYQFYFHFFFSFSLKTKTQQPPKCLQWIADVKLWSKKWYAIKNWFGFRFVLILFHVTAAFVPYTKMIPNYERHIPGYGIFDFFLPNQRFHRNRVSSTFHSNV